MKFYIHSDDPEFTMVVKWEDNRVGTVLEVLELFIRTLNSRLSMKSKYMAADSFLINSNKKEVKPSDSVSDKIQHMEDLYIKPVDKAVVKNDNENGSEDSDAEAEIIDHTKLASMLIDKQQYRKAILVFEDLLRLDKKNLQALLGLADVYLKAGRSQKALLYAERAIRCHPQDREGQFILGQCYVAVGDGDKALETLLKYCRDIRQQAGADTAQKHKLQVLLAKAYLLKKQVDMAITVLQGVLRENQQHLEALAEYAVLLFPLGPAQKEEAMAILLTALANQKNDSNVKKKFASVCQQPHGLDVLESVAGQAWTNVPALVFMATSIRDFGAMDEALKLMDHAYRLQPDNAHTLLTYVHMLEVVEKHSEGVQLIKCFLEKFPDQRAGCLSCHVIVPYVTYIDKDIYMFDSLPDCLPLVPTISPPDTEYTEGERYLLALWFTLVKILYIKGALSAILPLTKLLDPCTENQSLHLTNIRNETAYYTCISQVLKLHTSIPVLVPEARFIYFVGDSHCVPPAWQQICVNSTMHTIHPVLSTGTKIWHLRDKSKFYPKLNFHSAVRVIPDGATVVCCLGEIDCREALVVCVEKARYDSLEEGVDTVIDIYMEVLQKLKQSRGWNLYVHPVMPVLDLTRPIVMQFNKRLKSRLQREDGLKWLDFVHHLLSSDGSTLDTKFNFDSTHAHPAYVHLLEEALEKVSK